MNILKQTLTLVAEIVFFILLFLVVVIPFTLYMICLKAFGKNEQLLELKDKFEEILKILEEREGE